MMIRTGVEHERYRNSQPIHHFKVRVVESCMSSGSFFPAHLFRYDRIDIQHIIGGPNILSLETWSSG